MALEQIPGNLDLKIVQGDDFICQFNIPFNASGYTFTTNVYKTNEGIVSIPTAVSVQTSILTIVQTTFYASVTNTFEQFTGTKSHTWSMKYIDDASLTRTFISGKLEVV